MKILKPNLFRRTVPTAVALTLLAATPAFSWQEAPAAPEAAPAEEVVTRVYEVSDLLNTNSGRNNQFPQLRIRGFDGQWQGKFNAPQQGVGQNTFRFGTDAPRGGIAGLPGRSIIVRGEDVFEQEELEQLQIEIDRANAEAERAMAEAERIAEEAGAAAEEAGEAAEEAGRVAEDAGRVAEEAGRAAEEAARVGLERALALRGERDDGIVRLYRNVTKQSNPLIDAITTGIAPESWQANGGDTGTIFLYQDKLVVSHTPAVQQRVSDLLDGLRNEETLTIEAVLLPMRPETAKAGITTLSDDQVREMNGKITARVSGTGFDGESISVADGKTVGFVKDVAPVASNHAIGYAVQMGELQTGFTFEVLPKLRNDFAVLDVSAAMVELLESDLDREDDRNVPVPDRMTVDTRRINAQVKLPVGEWVVVGGMSRGTGENAEPMYLVVRVSTAASQ